MHYNSWGFAPAWWLGIGLIGLTLALVILVLSIVLKGYSLWTAARRNEKWWFVILLIVNTMGILELIYLIFVAKVKWSNLSKCCEKDHEHHHSHHDHNQSTGNTSTQNSGSGMETIK